MATLANKTVAIIGGNSGIGLRVAELAAAEQASISPSMAVSCLAVNLPARPLSATIMAAGLSVMLGNQ